MANTIILQQTAIADYRREFISLLCARLPHLRIITGSVYFKDTVITSPEIALLSQTDTVFNIFMFNRRLCLQVIDLCTVLQADAVVLEFNPRIISNWVVLLLRSLFKKHTVIWGHAWSRSGSLSRTEPLRRIYALLASSILFYTYSDRDAYLAQYPCDAGSLFVATNSLYSRESISPRAVKGFDFIYVGRLVREKKPDLMIKAFAAFISQLSPCASIPCLHIVGDGPLLADLKELSSVLNIGDFVKYYGHVSSISELSRLYEISIASLSPGYVGLAAIQSLVFGRPMIVSLNEPHAPEVEALKNGFNCVFFESDNVKALSMCLNHFWSSRHCWVNRVDSISSAVLASYSVESMVDGFIDSISL
jgi:glycosyltransferase involved in cell wall biosynthesis